MKKKLLFIFLLTPLFSSAMLPEPWPEESPTRDEKASQDNSYLHFLLNSSTILDLCRSEKKEDESCKVINNIFQRIPGAQWAKMSWIQQRRHLIWPLWHSSKAPMPADISRKILSTQARQLGDKLGWDKMRIDSELRRLAAEFDKHNDEK